MIPLAQTGLLDWYLRLLNLDRELGLTIELGPLSIDTTGRGVFFMWVTVITLAVSGIAVAISRNRELVRRWTTWLMIMPIVGLPLWYGRGPTAILAVILALIAVREYGRLVRLRRSDLIVLSAMAIAYPLLAWLHPPALALVPLGVLLCALPAILQADTDDGVRRAAFSGFASVWICWSLAHLVVLWSDAFLIVFAAAAADVAAWCGGKGLKRFAWARRPLSKLSPNKTVGGLVGAIIGAFIILTLLGTISVGLLIAVALGGVAGDLLESMVKRQAGVKDAGSWLPGFGGLLDRVDSLLLVLPLAAVLA